MNKILLKKIHHIQNNIPNNLKGNLSFVTKPFSLTLLSISLIALSYRILVLSKFEYIFFVDRDLYRSLNIFNDWTSLGPELSWGGRIPGSFYYLFLKLLLFIDKDPLFIYFTMIAGHLILAIIFFKFIKANFNLNTALLFVSLFFTLPANIENTHTIWNPSFAFIFSGFGFYLLMNMLFKNEDENRKNRFWTYFLFSLMIICNTAAAQCHLSHLILFPLTISMLLLYRRHFFSWPKILLGFFIFFLMYSPYVWYEFHHDFANIRAIILSAKKSFQDIGPYANSWENTGPKDFLYDFTGLNFFFFWANQKFQHILLPALTILGPLSMIISFFYFFSHQNKRKPNYKNKNQRNIIQSNALFFILGFCFLLISLGPKEICFRRANFLFLPACFLISFGMDKFVHYGKNQRLKKMWVIVFLVLNVLFYHFKFDLMFYRKRLNFNTLQSLVVDLRHKVGLTKVGVKNNVSMLLRFNNKWQFNQQQLNQEYPPQGKADLGFFEYTGLDYMNEITPEGDSPERHNCVLILSHIDLKTKNNSNQNWQITWQEILQDLPILKNLKVTSHLSGVNFDYVLFDKIQNNCPKTFTNRYILSAQEKEMKNLTETGNFKNYSLNSGHEKGKFSVNFENKIKIPLDRKIKQNFLFTNILNNSLLMEIDLIWKSKNSIAVNIFSNQLRGYDSITHYAFIRPHLVFKNSQNHEEVSYWPIPEEWQNYLVFTTPLYGELNLSPGEYEVTFRGNQILAKYAY